jgi:hypothetical protein
MLSFKKVKNFKKNFKNIIFLIKTTFLLTTWNYVKKKMFSKAWILFEIMSGSWFMMYSFIYDLAVHPEKFAHQDLCCVYVDQL